MRRRPAASASRARVNSFSLTSMSSRATSHCSRETTGGVFMSAYLLGAGVGVTTEATTGTRGQGATVRSVRIATWNVNSVKQRVPRLLPWLDQRQPDVACLQETKLTDGAFADLLGAELTDRGYELATHGEPTWNGVAILSRAGLEDVVTGLAGAPGFPHQEARAVSATCGGI